MKNIDEVGKQPRKINEHKSWFFEKIKNIDKTLTRVMKKKRQRNQINNIRSESKEVATDTIGIKRENEKILPKIHQQIRQPRRNC